MTFNPTDPKVTTPTKEQSTLILLFSIDKYDRADLNRMDCEELLEKARQAEEPDTLIYNVEEFCEASNDEQFSNDAYWLYNVCVEGYVETWR